MNELEAFVKKAGAKDLGKAEARQGDGRFSSEEETAGRQEGQRSRGSSHRQAPTTRPGTPTVGSGRRNQ
jgi:hypothetical protein